MLLPSVITTKRKLWIIYSLPLFVKNEELEKIVKEVGELRDNMIKN